VDRGEVARRWTAVTTAAALVVVAGAPAPAWAQAVGGQSTKGHLTVGDTSSAVTSAAPAQRRPGGLVAANRVGRPSISIPQVTVPPRIDGRLDDDAAWQTAARVTEFVQQWPVEGAPASERTEVYLAYDQTHLYIGLYAHYANARLIRANRMSRDRTVRDDTVILYFDPFRDEQRAYVFAVNGYGIQADGVLTEAATSSGGTCTTPGALGGGGIGVDLSWDALFQSAGQMVGDGWTAELAIPFTSLRFPRQAQDDGQSWGFQILREIRSKNERVVWAPLSRNVPRFLSQMGILDGLKDLPVSDTYTAGMFLGRPSVEIRPTVTPPQIDGRLDDDAAWDGAARVTEFVQQSPAEGAPASERTEVYLAYDDDHLYVGLYAHYSDPGLIRANRMDRDRTDRDDTVTFYLDPFVDQQRAYVFSVNGYGIQADGILTGGGASIASGAT